MLQRGVIVINSQSGETTIESGVEWVKQYRVSVL